MKQRTAKNILATLWLGGSVVYLLILFIKTQQFGNDAGSVWKEAPTFVAPMIALVMTFLFGVHHSNTDDVVPNLLSFWSAVGLSVVHLFVLFFGTFIWQKPILENIATLNIVVGYFSALTIVAMNFFFLGVAKTKPGP